MTRELEIFVLGMLAMASMVITLFFLKFWKKTRDGLFLAFAGLFAIDGVLRTVRAVHMTPGSHYEEPPWLYCLRLVAALLILLAIVRKNYRKPRKSEVSATRSFANSGKPWTRQGGRGR